ncbi:MAG: PaaI family thioesterase [Deltaproteobacteria bacterium]|nr:PaaI family thioesterase [Deltaproteobacteria bacterium]MBW2612302.1 PaaI family thioesterase [Deltaproteobacteria bacterium]
MIISSAQFEKFNANPLYHTIGMQVISAEDGRAVSQLRPPDNVCWPFPGQPHGGILFTQMDSTMAWAVLSAPGEGTNCTTVNLEIQYPAPARGPVFTCETRVVHRTGRSCFVRGESRDEEGGLVAMGQATFRIIRAEAML